MLEELGLQSLQQMSILENECENMVDYKQTIIMWCTNKFIQYFQKTIFSSFEASQFPFL